MTDIVERLNDSLSAGYDSLSAGYSELRKEAAEEIMRLRAKIAQMEKQRPAAWCGTDETGTVVEALGMNQSRRFDTALYLASGAQNVPKAVAYLDLGVGGYMDIGTDLTDEALAALPKGRHMLGIVGTYGVDGYVPAQLESSVPDGWKLVPIEPTTEIRKAMHYAYWQSPQLPYHDGSPELWNAAYAAMLEAAPEAK